MELVAVERAGLAAMSPGPRLAAALAGIELSAVSNDGLVEVLQAQARQVAHEQGRLLEVIAEVGVASDELGAEHTTRRRSEVSEWAYTEIAAALTLTANAGASELSFANAVVRRLPQVHAALLAGEIDRPRAWVFADYLGGLSEAQIGVVCTRLVPIAPRLTTGQLRARLIRILAEIDPDHARRRYERAVQQRGLVGSIADDGTITMVASGLPADEATAACARIEQLAEAVHRAGHRAWLGAIRTDLFLALLMGRFHGLTEDQIIAQMLTEYRPEDGVAADGVAPGPVQDDPTTGHDRAESGGPDEHQASTAGDTTADDTTADDTTADDDVADDDVADDDVADDDVAGGDVAGGDVAGGDVAGDNVAGDNVAGDNTADDDAAGDTGGSGRPGGGEHGDVEPDDAGSGGAGSGDGRPDGAGLDGSGLDDVGRDDGGPDDSGPGDAGPDGASTDEGGPAGGDPDEGGPDRGGPDDGGPDDGGPDDGGPDDGGPDRRGPDSAGTDEGGPDWGGPDCGDSDGGGSGDAGPDGRGLDGRGPPGGDLDEDDASEVADCGPRRPGGVPGSGRCWCRADIHREGYSSRAGPHPDGDLGGDLAGGGPARAGPDPGVGGGCDGAGLVRAGVEIRVGIATLLGRAQRCGEVPGLGPVLPGIACRIVAAQRRGARWRFAITDADGYLSLGGLTRRRPHLPGGGACRGGVVELHVTAQTLADLITELITALGSPGSVDPLLAGWAPVLIDLAEQYRNRDQALAALDTRPFDRFPSAALARHVELRDRTCSHPGCRRAARASDKDHTRDHEHGGPTIAENLGPCCGRHHTCKHRTAWRLTQPQAGRFCWRSPLGKLYETRGELIIDPDSVPSCAGPPDPFLEIPPLQPAIPVEIGPIIRPRAAPTPRSAPPPVDSAPALGSADDPPPF